MLVPNYLEIRRRREELGLSGRGFAKSIGMNYVTLSNIETGKKGASPAMLKKISKGLSCLIQDISISKTTKRISASISKELCEDVLTKSLPGETESTLFGRIIKEWLKAQK